MLKRSFILFLFFCSSLDLYSQGVRDILPDSVSLVEELKNHAYIPNLSYRIQVLGEELPESQQVIDSTFLWTRNERGYLSPDFENGAQLESLVSDLPENSVELQFYVFGEKSSIDGVYRFLETLVDTGDFVYAQNQKSTDRDLVLIANRYHYQPIEAYKNLLLSDNQLFGVTLINVFFVLAAVSMIIFMLIFKKRRNQREEQIKDFENEIIGPLTSLLFEKSVDQINEMSKAEADAIFQDGIIQKKLFKIVLIDKIIGLNKKMKGDFKDKLKLLYQKFGLIEITQQNLEHRKWEKIARGLVQVNEMDLKMLLPLVKEHVNSSNFHVRSLAGATLLNIAEKVDLNFLRDQNYPLSDWQQMHYLRIIKYIAPSKSLQISKLFGSTNQSVREFGFKLVRMLGRVDLIQELHEINEKVSLEERVELIKTYDSLGAHMEVDFINSCMKSNHPELKKEAIKCAGNLGNEESEDIIILLITENPEFKIRKILLNSLLKLNPVRFEQFVSDFPMEENLKIKAHLFDPVLSHV